MDANFIRGMIFLTAGLIVILFPNGVYRFQDYVLRKFHIKHNKKVEDIHYDYMGIVFIAISIFLFVVSIIY